MTNRPVTMAVVAATEPVAVCKIATIGLLEFKASSIDPIDTSMTMTMTYPKTPFINIDQKIARGTADLAFLTSSLM